MSTNENVDNCRATNAADSYSSGSTGSLFRKKISERSGSGNANEPGDDNFAYYEFQAYVQDVWDLDDESTSLSKFGCDQIAQCHGKRITNVAAASAAEPTTSNRPNVQIVQKKNTSSEDNRAMKFQELLNRPIIELGELSTLSWSGVPAYARATVWRLLSGFLPLDCHSRQSVLIRKRTQYFDFVQRYFYSDHRTANYQEIYHQIHIDVPRMNSIANFFHQKKVQEMFERILYILAVHYPDSGYVQGMNDLVTPFFVVFLQEILDDNAIIEKVQLADINEELLNVVEADSFWCLAQFLDRLQDNYVCPQTGIQEKVVQLKDLVERIDVKLHNHLIENGVDYLQFSFRWMNNLLTRELPLRCTIRLWDTYLSEQDEFPVFQVYVYAAFLIRWRTLLFKEVDFQGLMLLLQHLPTHNWHNDEINVLLAEAFKLKSMFANAPKHLQSGGGGGSGCSSGTATNSGSGSGSNNNNSSAI